MIVERTMIYSLFAPDSNYLRMVVYQGVRAQQPLLAASWLNLVGQDRNPETRYLESQVALE